MSQAVGNKMSTCDHYAVMGIDEICSMPVRDIAAMDSVLFLWCVSPQIPEALRVINAWGFKFVTVAFCWSKLTSTGKEAHNLGRWTLGNVELCLLARRGKISREARNIRQLVVAPRARHSAKPPEVRDRIVRLMGDIPRVELFARARCPGWISWGNELEEP
jgi:N6-adenosine-specific RNA methylase IME4